MSVWSFGMPIRTYNPLNGQHGHWSKQAKKRKTERELTAMFFRSAAVHQGKPKPPVDVMLVRVGPKRMDDEGCIASLKSIRDQVAQELGVDDGDEAAIRFSYRQLRSWGGKRQWSVEVHISERPLIAVSGRIVWGPEEET